MDNILDKTGFVLWFVKSVIHESPVQPTKKVKYLNAHEKKATFLSLKGGHEEKEN